MTGIKLLLCLLLDTFLVSTLPFSLQLGINGIGYTNILVNAVLFSSSLALLARENIIVFSKEKLSFTWMKEFVKIGSISGLESFVRNIAYMLMIVRMVNMVSEQGTYWVANNFIWGWLLLPITQLAELIKQEVATNHENAKRNASGYFAITTGVCILWFLTIPFWKPFMTNILGFSDVEKLFRIVILLIGFYVLYAFQNVFDATFYGLAKTQYMLFESAVTNSIYYGIAFILYLSGAWVPSLTGIALLFGIGNAFDAVVSLGAYIYLRKRIKD